MDLQVGDIIHCDAPITDHPKYHICILECGSDGKAACFLFLNSNPGWKGDLVFDNASFPCLPPSETGKTVVSFSLVPRYNAVQLAKYRAKIVGKIDAKVARQLEAFAKQVPTLMEDDRKTVLRGLARITTKK
jgi:hypothetical protein